MRWRNHKPSAPEIVTKDQWIIKCSERFQIKAGVTKDVGAMLAMTCWNSLAFDGDDPLLSDPAVEADDEMSYWD